MNRNDLRLNPRPGPPTKGNDLRLPARPPPPAKGYERYDPMIRNYSHYNNEPILSAAGMARQSGFHPNQRFQSGFSIGSGPSQNRGGAQKPRAPRIPKEAFSPGMIIRAPVHEPNLDRALNPSQVTVNDGTVTETLYGLVTSKYRYMIVTATYSDHYIAIPLYTHNGHGLTRKLNPDEYVSLRDHRRPGPFSKLSAHKPLLTKDLKPEINLFDPVTTAHIPYPISRGYILPAVHEGSLEPESTRNLLKLIRKSE